MEQAKAALVNLGRVELERHAIVGKHCLCNDCFCCAALGVAAKLSSHSAKRSYEVEVLPMKSVKIDADTRSSAAKIARTLGFEVRSVNLVG